MNVLFSFASLVILLQLQLQLQLAAAAYPPCQQTSNRGNFLVLFAEFRVLGVVKNFDCSVSKKC